jgi:Rrf2 family protein
MNITLESDYAIRIVVSLAQQKERCDAGKISELTGVPQRFALKILRKLVNAGLLCSFKGIGGGYQLQQDASRISLADIIEVIEGPYAISRCLNKANCCTHPNRTDGNTEPCKVQQVFGEISKMVNQKLQSTTVDKLL